MTPVTAPSPRKRARPGDRTARPAAAAPRATRVPPARRRTDDGDCQGTRRYRRVTPGARTHPRPRAALRAAASASGHTRAAPHSHDGAPRPTRGHGPMPPAASPWTPTRLRAALPTAAPPPLVPAPPRTATTAAPAVPGGAGR